MYLHLLVVALQLVLFQATLLLQTTLLVEFFEATLLQVVCCLADQVFFGLTPLLFLGLHENNRPEIRKVSFRSRLERDLFSQVNPVN